MRHEPFFLFHHNVLILLDCFSVMIHCISKEAFMRAKQLFVLVTKESRAKISASKMHLSPPVAKAAVGSKVVVLLLIYCLMELPILCGSSVFVFVLLSISLCRFYFYNHLKEEDKACCFAINVLLMYCYYKCSVALRHGAVSWSSVCD